MTYLDGMEQKFGVIALGGNAILQRGKPATPDNQMAALRTAIDKLSPALSRYAGFALTHGNGPQVGIDLIRSYQAHIHAGIAELGLADCVANTQGRLGHWIVCEMKNHPELSDTDVANIITHVYVSKNDFSDNEYVKRVGPWLPADPEKLEEMKARGVRFLLSDDKSEFIRVVPSPEPYKIEEFKHIARLVSAGVVTICCGGGGIPVFEEKDHGRKFEQVDVVIDKDLASSLLARDLLSYLDGADVELVILMETKGLYRDKSFSSESFVHTMTLDELNEFLKENTLEAGTILPKITAIQRFLSYGGKRAYLGPLDGFDEIFKDGSGIGTIFTNSPQMNLYDTP